MVASKVLISSMLAASVSASGSPFAAFLQARADLSPGSPGYNCHDNCGMFSAGTSYSLRRPL